MTTRSVLGRLTLACSLFSTILQPASASSRGGHAVYLGSSVGVGLYDPYWGGFPYPGAYGGAATGTIKFDTDHKDAAVYVEGGYAGTVGKLKSLHLRPGAYNLELRIAGTAPYSERVYVAAGKTVHLNPGRTSQP